MDDGSLRQDLLSLIALRFSILRADPLPNELLRVQTTLTGKRKKTGSYVLFIVVRLLRGENLS